MCYRMPKKTKQWGWQCSECDKEPDMHPISFTPQIDIEAPRASRNRGQPKTSHSHLLCKLLFTTRNSQVYLLYFSQVTLMLKVQ